MKYRPGERATERARALRSNSTDAEKALWRLLKESFPEARFRRQVPIRNFVADFASHSAKLVIEVDGGQHDDAANAERTRLIEADGYRVVRFWNHEVLGNRDGVWAVIDRALRSEAPPLDGSAATEAASGGSSQAADGLGRGGVSEKAPSCVTRHPHPNPPPSRGRASGEASFIASLRSLATTAAARDLLDDAAVLEVGGARLVLTHDMIVEGVHFLPSDPPGDVAWKLVAVNLSDLAAKGARPVGAMLGYSLGGSEWDSAFVAGLKQVLEAFGCPLLGGDTVSAPAGAPRSFGLTAIGEATGNVPSRSGARVGDYLWVSGTIGDAGAGLRALRGEIGADEALIERYRLPRPRLEAGQALAPIVTAMMDVSDGLLIDASRLGEASGVSVTIELGDVPLSEAFLAALGDGREARMEAASAGDDYELLFTAPAEKAAEILRMSEHLGLPFSRIGRVEEGSGLVLRDHGDPVPLPDRLGYEHKSG